MHVIVASILRPVILISPFAGSLIAKLASESPDKFCCLDFGMRFDVCYACTPLVIGILCVINMKCNI